MFEGRGGVKAALKPDMQLQLAGGGEKILGGGERLREREFFKRCAGSLKKRRFMERRSHR